jgi:hypothetical protein
MGCGRIKAAGLKLEITFGFGKTGDFAPVLLLDDSVTPIQKAI